MAEETSIWDMPDNRPEKIIYVPILGEKIYQETLLSRQLSAEAAKEKAYDLKQELKKYKLVAFDEKGKKYTPDPIKLMYSNQKKLKKDYISFIVIIEHPNNFSLFSETWSEPVKELFRKAIKEHYVYHKDATKILGESSIQKNSRFYYADYEPSNKIKRMYRTITAKAPEKRTYDNRDYFLSLTSDSSIYRNMLPKIIPGLDKMEQCGNLPHAEEYKTYSGEKNIFTVFPILSSMFDNNLLNIGRAKLPANELKRAAKLISLPEFFDDGNKYFSNVCASMVLNIFTVYCEDWYDNDLKETHALLKDLLQNADEYQENLLPVLMPHFTGFRKTLTDCCSCGSIITNLCSILKDNYKYGWLPIEKISYLCRTNPNYGESSYLMFYASDLNKVTLHNDYDGNDIYLSNFLHEVTRPYVKAVFFLLAAFGFVEIAYREKPAEGATSYYDGLEYVRLTNLGLYALGIKNKYVRTKEADIKYFELDCDRLIIKSLVDNNPYESLLGNMATAISKKMYKVSYESFLSGCEKLQDITAKIDFFKDYICDTPPTNWKQFFKELKDRCKPMKEPQKKYSLLQIPSGNKELQRIILGDSVIRKYTLKAEDFIILVETANKSKVVDALKKYGYLL